jgi:hypothetical protein
MPWPPNAIPPLSQARVYRRLDALTFTGDAWARLGSQATPPADLWLVAKRSVSWVVVPYSGLLDTDTPVDDALTLIDAASVSLARDAQSNVYTARTRSLVQCYGEEQLSGELLADDGLAPGSLFALGLPTITFGGARPGAFWIFASGAEPYV